MDALMYRTDTSIAYLYPRYYEQDYFVKEAIIHFNEKDKKDREEEKRKEREKERIKAERKATKEKEKGKRKGKPLPKEVKVKLTPEEKEAKRKRDQHTLQQRYTARQGKLRSVFNIIHEALNLSNKVLFVNVVLKVPTVEEITGILAMVGLVLTPVEKATLKNLGNSNKAMKVFRRNFERMLRREDAVRDRIQSPRLFIAWTREYGKKKGRRHYHLLIGINGSREGAAGPYHCLPDAFGNLSKRIAHVWLETLGLDTHEFTNLTSNEKVLVLNEYIDDDTIIVDKETGEVVNKTKEGNPKSLFGWLVYYPGKKGGRKVQSTKIYKSCLVHKEMKEKDMHWIYKVVRYMLKRETKEIPEAMRGWVYEKERTFGCTLTIGY